MAAPASPLGGTAAVELRQVSIYLQHNVTLQVADGSSATTTDLVADSRTILVAFSDGACQALSWAAQVGSGLASAIGQLFGEHLMPGTQ